MPEYEQVHPESRAQWRAWLERHHAETSGIWLVYWRAATGRRLLSYDEVVEEALCFGWIDGRVRPVDAERSSIMVTPRRRGSAWAGTNKRRIERLEAEGLMTDAGRRVIERARADGSWTILDDVEARVIPDDLAAALAAEPEAQHHFEAFPATAKQAALYWIKTAKRDETRQRRIAETVRLAADNIRAPQ